MINLQYLFEKLSGKILQFVSKYDIITTVECAESVLTAEDMRGSRRLLPVWQVISVEYVRF